MRVFSNLNLDGSSVERSQPKRGVWGPEKVPSTKFKKFQRAIMPVLFVLLAAIIVGVAYFFFKQIFPDPEEQSLALLNAAIVTISS